MFLHYCGNIKPYAWQEVQLNPSLQYVTAFAGTADWESVTFFPDNNKESEVNSAHKQCSTLSLTLLPLGDLRSAYPFSPAPNSLELWKHDWLLVQPEHVTEKPAHPQDTCISSNPICSFVHLPAPVSFPFSFSLPTKTHNPFRSQEA